MITMLANAIVFACASLSLVITAYKHPAHLKFLWHHYAPYLLTITSIVIIGNVTEANRYLGGIAFLLAGIPLHYFRKHIDAPSEHRRLRLDVPIFLCSFGMLMIGLAALFGADPLYIP